MTSTADSAEVFTEHRGLLFTIAYEMLGSTAEAEDVVQDSYLRWAAVDVASIHDPRAYLVRVVTRQALNRLRTLKRRRESYVGPWLPEPLVTTPDVAEDIELAESVSFALLVVLETLTPLERAVFVLREVFGFSYDEIATATGRSVPAVRQVAARAKKHVQARRPRVDRAADHQQVAARFFAAASSGALQPLLDLMAPDVVLLTDGGGQVQAALRPVRGPDKVARFLQAVLPADGELAVEWRVANGGPAVLLSVGGVLDSLAAVSVAGGLVQEIYVVRNPDKLRTVRQVYDVTRG